MRSGAAATLGLVALGFTSVYREGFEVVLFLQSLRLKAGTGVVLEGRRARPGRDCVRRPDHLLARPHPAPVPGSDGRARHPYLV